MLGSIDLTSFTYSALASSDVIPFIEFHASHLAFSLLKIETSRSLSVDVPDTPLLIIFMESKLVIIRGVLTPLKIVL